MNKIDKKLLEQIADLHSTPLGAYSIRKNGEIVSKNSTSDIQIIPKPDNNSMTVYIKAGLKNKSLHIPVIVTAGEFKELVYNDFYIGDNADVVIIAGCGIDNKTCHDSEHSGVHSFWLGKNCKLRYIEKHFGSGIGTGNKILNPQTKIYLKENSKMEIETLQLGGVDFSKRETKARLEKNASLIVKENIQTSSNQIAMTDFIIQLRGENSSAQITSHSVARDNSKQSFTSHLVGNNKCFGRVECDGILLDNAQILSVPKIEALKNEALLSHEATIGKIAGEQLVKLMSLGLSKEDAEQKIIQGFLLG